MTSHTHYQGLAKKAVYGSIFDATSVLLKLNSSAEHNQSSNAGTALVEPKHARDTKERQPCASVSAHEREIEKTAIWLLHITPPCSTKMSKPDKTTATFVA